MGFEGESLFRNSNSSSDRSRAEGWHRPSLAERTLDTLVNLVKSNHEITQREGFREIFLMTVLAVILEKYPFIGMPVRTSRPRPAVRRETSL